MIDPALTRNLVLDHKGIWRSEKVTSVSYPDDAHQSLFALEDDSFWFQHRNKCVMAIIQRFPPRDYIIDVGGGNGFVSRCIQAAGFNVVLLEPGQEGVLNARSRGVKHIFHTTFQGAGFSKNSLDSIGLFDVLEHIQDDHAFLSMVHSSMKSGGRLYVTVPAHQYLWSWVDKRAGHFRRYSISSVTQTMNESGFNVKYASCFFSGLSFPIFVSRTLPTLLRLPKDRSHEKREKTHRTRKGLSGKILDRHWRREVEKLKSSRIMNGSSVIAVAEPVKA